MAPALRLLLVILCACGLRLHAADAIKDIGFGSCLDKTEHPMLERTLTLPMELFTFLGDNIYADSTDMAVMRSKYKGLRVFPWEFERETGTMWG